jgi:hypothetical protein
VIPHDTVAQWVAWAFLTGSALGMTAGAGLTLLAVLMPERKHRGSV